MSLKSADHLQTGKRRLRLGIVGGGLVSHWHHSGIRLSNRWDLVAGALSSDSARAIERGQAWLLDESRSYTDFRQMAKMEAARPDGIEAVAICTPNHTHREICDAFMGEGIDVVCDKPMANSLDDGRQLVELQRRTGLVFAVTHPYAYHPMVLQAREMIAAGMIGGIRQVMLEYAQEWASLETPGAPEDEPWRKDPERAGRTSTTGDIGTHAFHLLEYTTGLKVNKLRADFHVCGPERVLEDTAFINFTLDQGAPGVMWLSQVAAGQHCGLRLRIFGDLGSILWDQELPEQIRYGRLNEPEQLILRGQGAGMLPLATARTRLPRGHGESLSDAWASLYRDIATAVAARRDGQLSPATEGHLPDVDDGLRGIQFVHAAADSHEAGGHWIDVVRS